MKLDSGRLHASRILTTDISLISLPIAVNFRLNQNFWTGSIPNVFSNYQKLDYFDISNTLLSGNIPSSLFSIPTIRLIYLSNSTITGTIPSQYSNPPLLRDLYLDGNPLSGTVPPIRDGQLQFLNEFLVHRTELSGRMPVSICDLRTNNILDDLWSDCGGNNPEIECDFPDCCNRCFEGN